MQINGVSPYDDWRLALSLGNIIITDGVLPLAHDRVAFAYVMVLFAWSTGPVQQVYLIGMAPQASGIILSLNNSIVQLGMAVGAVIGGIVVENISLASVGLLGGAFVAIGLIPAIISLSMRRRSAAAERNGA